MDIIFNTNKLFCSNCKYEFKLNRPYAVSELLKLAEAFILLHKDCKNEFIEQPMPNFDIPAPNYKSQALTFKIPPIPSKGIAVDVGCKGNPGKTEYRGIDLETGEIIFHHFIKGLSTNNIGEFMGCIEGLKYAQSKGKDYPVYSDSQTAISWIRQRKCKTNFNVTNEEQKKMIHDAEQYLLRFGGKIIKWRTDLHGQIPADFGRK